MPSVLPGYEYDIFISYRHNDNLDGWVTDFVHNLEKELRSTLKDTVTIYFDKNPHDGLLETHSVDKSLEGKLKCLIFIPIISQTYCDPKSFAWQHEFCAFNRLALNDPLGRDIKLTNGNVGSRILPIRIHDLDPEDKQIIESELGGILRAIEFTFKGAGVNRPLAPSDKKEDNADKTFYRDQINKAANAIKELISGIRNRSVEPIRVTTDKQPASPSTKRRLLAMIIIALLLLAAVAYIIYQQSTRDQHRILDKSIAVLPFADMSPNHDQEFFGDGMAEEIINVLAQSEDLKVIARTSSFQFKGKNEDLRTIGKMLGVSTVLEGSVRKSENLIRVTAQLIETEDGTHLWSKTFDRKPMDILHIYDEIASAIASELKVTLSISKGTVKQDIWNDEAMKLYQTGRFYFDRASDGDDFKARAFFKKSLDVDSTHAVVWAYYAITFNSTDKILADQINRKALQLDSTNADALANKAYLSIMKDFDHPSAKRLSEKAFFLYPHDARVLRTLCYVNASLGLLPAAIAYGKMAITADPLKPRAFDFLGNAYYLKKEYDSSNHVYQKLKEINPNYGGIENYFALNYLMMGQYEKALLEIKAPGTKAMYECIIAAINGDKKTSDEKLTAAKLNMQGWDSNYALAVIHCFRKEYEVAVDYIERSFNAREVSVSLGIKVDPQLDPIRHHPRFLAVLRKFD